ncbi:MAG: transposase, partial [Myxococcota bacterium]
LSLMSISLEAPDHTTLSRRSQHLDVDFHLIPANEPIHLIVDSTGLSMSAKASGRPSSMEDAASVPGRNSISVSIGLV